MGDELDGGFEVVEEAVDVGEEDLDGAAGAEEVRDLEDGHEVAAVGTAGGGGSWGGRGMVSHTCIVLDGEKRCCGVRVPWKGPQEIN